MHIVVLLLLAATAEAGLTISTSDARVITQTPLCVDFWPWVQINRNSSDLRGVKLVSTANLTESQVEMFCNAQPLEGLPFEGKWLVINQIWKSCKSDGMELYSEVRATSCSLLSFHARRLT